MPDVDTPDEQPPAGAAADDGEASPQVSKADRVQDAKAVAKSAADLLSSELNLKKSVAPVEVAAPDEQPKTMPTQVSRHEQRRTWLKRKVVVAALLTAVLVVVLFSSGVLQQDDESQQLALSPRVVFDNMCAAVAKNKLDKLHVSTMVVDDEMMSQVIELSSIETLIIDKGIVTDRSMITFAALPKLRHLRLRRSPISDEGLRTIAQCESLWYLNLPHAVCTEKGVAWLTQLPRLRQLRLGSPQLGNEVTSAIAKIETLRGVHLIGVAVTDDGLKRIAAMPNLESLYLDDSKVTEAGWEWLFKNYPQLHVHINQSHHDRDPKAHVHHE